MSRLPIRMSAEPTGGDPGSKNFPISSTFNINRTSMFQDVFKRRAEIETNYSRDLEKLSKLLLSRHKEQKLKREGWTALSSTAIWRQLVEETKKAGKVRLARIDENIS